MGCGRRGLPVSGGQDVVDGQHSQGERLMRVGWQLRDGTLRLRAMLSAQHGRMLAGLGDERGEHPPA